MQDIAEVRLLFVFGAHPAHGEVLRKAFTGKGNELCIIDVVVRIEVVRPHRERFADEICFRHFHFALAEILVDRISRILLVTTSIRRTLRLTEMRRRTSIRGMLLLTAMLHR